MIESSLSRYIHNRATTLLQHHPHCSPRQRITRSQIQIHHRVKHLSIELPQFHSAHIPAHSIHQHIQSPMPPHDSSNQRSHCRLIRNIRIKSLQPHATIAASKLGQSIKLVPLAISNSHARPSRKKSQTNRPPQSASPPSHQHHFIRCHLLSPFGSRFRSGV